MNDGAWTEEWYREAEESVKRLQEARQSHENGFCGLPTVPKGESHQTLDLVIPDDPRWLTDNPDTRRYSGSKAEWWQEVSFWEKKRMAPSISNKERNTNV